MIKLNIERGGNWGELETLQSDMVTKVIPRLLRPLEVDGRSVKPSLVHGDLWCGNTAVDTETGLPLVYDPSSFYAHNECGHETFVTFQNNLVTHFRRAWQLAP